jgi:hypothetical protein
VQNNPVVENIVDDLGINEEQFNLPHLFAPTCVAQDGLALLSLEDLHKGSNAFAFDCEIFVNSSALFSQQDEDKEGIELGTAKKLVEKLYFVVAGFVVVESVEKTQKKFAKSALSFSILVYSPQLKEQVFLEMSSERFIFD